MKLKYILLAVLGVVLALSGYFVHRVLVKNAEAVATATAHEQALETLAKTEQAKRQTAEADVQALKQQVAARAQATATARAKVLAPKPIAAVKADAEQILHIAPVISPDLTSLVVRPADIQKVTAAELSRQELERDNTDLRKIVTDDEQQIASFKVQLAATQSMNTEWKNVAKKSKKAKVLDAIKKGAEVGAVGFIAFEIGSHR